MQDSVTSDKKLVVIEKEDAVFYMDKNGRWLNEDGPITKKSIIRYLNSTISKDENGYYLTHMLGEKREKVYFSHEDTALFVIDLKITSAGISALLNTRRKLEIKPEGLFLKNDSLYLKQEGHIIKFSERGAVKLAPLFHEQGNELIITIKNRDYLIPDH